MVNRELIACGSGPARIKALGRNHMLWSLLVKDLALSDNQMPDPLKSELIALGLWSMRYSTLAILKDLPVEPLIEVNTNMADGLAQQQANAAAAQPPAPAASFAI
jgi:flagellar protein FlaF